MKEIDIKQVKDECIKWIRNWFEINGKGCNAVLGLSGGKDSTIVAKLCVEAIGKDRVIGVAMPDTLQGLNEANKIAEYLGSELYLYFDFSGKQAIARIPSKYFVKSGDDIKLYIDRKKSYVFDPKTTATLSFPEPSEEVRLDV